MAKKSAGLLLYHFDTAVLKVLLLHPGGPFFAKKDAGVWSIPKGEYEDGEDALEAAKRELKEETGNTISSAAFVPLTPVKLKSGKIVQAWAVEARFEPAFISSNLFEMEWPPKSGKKQQFYETDKGDWFTIEEAKVKINPGQIPLLEELVIKVSG